MRARSRRAHRQTRAARIQDAPQRRGSGRRDIGDLQFRSLILYPDLLDFSQFARTLAAFERELAEMRAFVAMGKAER